mmetsp:Transcript_49937/g.141522  ORF Transcript_49937/g.141522 Transcript_49937/m.141522 type:complete len:632 (-) Transcript_49937:19-1914(-)
MLHRNSRAQVVHDSDVRVIGTHQRRLGQMVATEKVLDFSCAALSLFLILANVVHAMHRGCCIGTAGKLKAWCMGRFVQSTPGTDGNSTDAEELAQERLRETQMSYARFISTSGRWVTLGVSVVLVLDYLAGSTGRPRRYLMEQCVALAAQFLWFTVFALCPRALVPSRLKYFFFVTVLLAQAAESPMTGADKLKIASRDGRDSIISLVVGVASLDPHVTAGCIVGAAICRTSMFMLADGEIAGFPLSEFLIHKLSITVFLLILAYQLRTFCSASLRNEIEAKIERNQRNAFTSLLSLMCDAVVELGPDLTIVEHCPALAHTLLHGTSSGSLEGRKFQQLIPDDEAEALFVRSVSEPEPHLVSHPDSFHISLRDSIGNRIAFQAYHVSFLTPFGVRHHLIGLLEDVETNHASKRSQRPETKRLGEEDSRNSVNSLNSSPDSSPEVLIAELAARGTDAALARHDSSQTNESVLSDGRTGLQVDFFVGASLEISWASPAFRKTYGDSVHLTEHLPDSKDFKEWLLMQITRLAESRGAGGGGSSPALEEYGFLQLAGTPSGDYSNLRSSSGRRRVQVLFPAIAGVILQDGKVPDEWLSGYRVSTRIGQRLGLPGPRSEVGSEGRGTAPVHERHAL